ncbi:MAG: hypothetical protein FWD38_02655 [Oscillospiraceae bacterium]|nr:hypothetical protein [Oscillospiraceae bacterium]
MKKRISILLAMALLLSFVALACDTAEPAPAPTPAPTPEVTADPPPEPPAPPPSDDTVFVWNNYADRQPGEDNKPDLSVNGMPIWWNNWANLRGSNDGGHVTINFRPEAFDEEDFDDLADYFARPGDWMGNFGEAVDMWAIEGISYCKYMTIRMGGAAGGEENKILLHFQPNDGPLFAARFADLVTKDGGNVEITTDIQDIVIDLEASGFPGMTNRMHIRAFVECTIMLEEISFSSPVAPVTEDPLDGITVQPKIETLGDLPIQSWADAFSGMLIWNNYIGRTPSEDAKPDLSTGGVPIWWSNFANLRGEVVDDGMLINFRPRAFDSDDYDDEDAYFAGAMDWMGNFGEAVDVWALDDVAIFQFITFRMRGLEGGEEDKILLHFQPNDGPVYIARFSDLVALGGGSPKITTEMDDVVIDLTASGFPGITNRMHIRAFAECGIVLQEIFFSTPVGEVGDDVDESIQVDPELPFDRLSIKDFVAQVS